MAAESWYWPPSTHATGESHATVRPYEFPVLLLGTGATDADQEPAASVSAVAVYAVLAVSY